MKKHILILLVITTFNFISCKKEKEEQIVTTEYNETPKEMIDSTATKPSSNQTNTNKNYSVSLNEFAIDDALKNISENLYTDERTEEVGFILNSTKEEVTVTPIDFSLEKNKIDESWIQNTSCNAKDCLAEQLKITIEDLTKKGKELKIKVLKNGVTTTVFTKK